MRLTFNETIVNCCRFVGLIVDLKKKKLLMDFIQVVVLLVDSVAIRLELDYFSDGTASL